MTELSEPTLSAYSSTSFKRQNCFASCDMWEAQQNLGVRAWICCLHGTDYLIYKGRLRFIWETVTYLSKGDKDSSMLELNFRLGFNLLVFALRHNEKGTKWDIFTLMWGGSKTFAAPSCFVGNDWLLCNPALYLLSLLPIGLFFIYPPLLIGQVRRTMSSYWLNIVALERG